MLAELREELRELEASYEQDRGEIREFEKRYQPAVGSRQEMLDEIRRQTAAAWEQIRRARSGEPLQDEPEDGVSKEIPQQSFNPQEELRKLFRELARRVHPDLTSDPDERRRRHEFMAEATRAYRADDHRHRQRQPPQPESAANALDDPGAEAIVSNRLGCEQRLQQPVFSVFEFLSHVDDL